MGSDDLIKTVRELMRERGTNQRGLSCATGLCQPHLSKVLRGRLPLATRTSAALLAWIDGGATPATRLPTDDIAALAAKLQGLPPGTVMQFMQIVDILADIVRPETAKS